MKQRNTPTTLLALLMFVQGGFYLAIFIEWLIIIAGLIAELGIDLTNLNQATIELITATLGVNQGGGLLYAVASLVIALGLWRVRDSSWLAALILEGVLLATYLFVYFTNDGLDLTGYIPLALAAVIVLSLNQSDVRTTFEDTPAEELR